MHSLNIIHRDIKPENITISYVNKTKQKLILFENIFLKGILKLCDLGYASYFGPRNLRTTLCGTLDYVSPEMIEYKIYNNSVDIWSVGVLTFELLVGRAPFTGKNHEETFEKVVKVLFFDFYVLFFLCVLRNIFLGNS